jgi:electron transfer flavoprotein beta subunit
LCKILKIFLLGIVNMNIIVCVKHVPSATDVKIDEEKGTLIREGIEMQLNPFDLYAIEQGMRLKERYDANLIAISMGPMQAEKSLREAIAMGCDDAILLSDSIFAGADTLATSYTLASAIKKIGFDIIICGVKSTDGDTGQVGPGVAEFLNIPNVCYVTKDIGEPRLPSFRGKMKAKKVQISLWSKDNLPNNENLFGLDGSATKVFKIFPPPTIEETELLSGTVSEQARKLINRLEKLKII